MPFIIAQEYKKQKYLLIVFGLVIVLSIFILWRGISGNKVVVGPEPAVKTAPSVVLQKVNINWQLLEGPQLKNLNLFEQAPSYDGQIGRDNPFVSY